MCGWRTEEISAPTDSLSRVLESIMPIYEYHCDQCDHTYESIRILAKRDDPSPCPKCGSSGKIKLSVFAFRDGKYGHIFKSGFQVSPSTPKEDKPA